MSLRSRTVAAAAVVALGACTRDGGPGSEPPRSAPVPAPRTGAYVFPGSRSLHVHESCSYRAETRQACADVATVVLGAVYPGASFPEDVRSSTVRVLDDGRVRYDGELYDEGPVLAMFRSIVEGFAGYGIEAVRVDEAGMVATLRGSAYEHPVNVSVTTRRAERRGQPGGLSTVRILTRSPV